MPEANSSVNISSDGTVTTFDIYGVRIKELCGELPILHKIVEINRMSAAEKRRLPAELRLRHVRFFFVVESQADSIEVPLTHLMRFIKNIEGKDIAEFMVSLTLLPRN